MAKVLAPPRPAGYRRGSRSAYLTLESEPEAVRKALLRLRSRLALEPDDADTIELVLAEVLNNVVEHAYGGLTGGRIEIAVTRTHTHFNCLITDHGTPMPFLQAPSGRLADLDVDLQDLPEGGFGWTLVRQMTQALDYRRVGMQNRLWLKIDLSGTRRRCLS